LHITGGLTKGKNIKIPANKNLRPTTGVVKECIFNIISGDIQEKSVLDLYAGCGALGIEALSRGAKSCTFIDNSKLAIKYIKMNLQSTGYSKKSEVVKAEVLDFLQNTRTSQVMYDYIFADPPYNYNDYNKLVNVIETTGILSAHGRFFLEHGIDSFKNILSKDLQIRKTRKFGSTKLTIFEWRNK